jgi:hypothetical protein
MELALYVKVCQNVAQSVTRGIPDFCSGKYVEFD